MLELIGNARCDDVIGANIYGTGKVAFINQVDFIINIGRHIFVEEIRRTNVGGSSAKNKRSMPDVQPCRIRQGIRSQFIPGAGVMS